MKNKRYIVVGYPSWSKDVFFKKISKYSGQWYLISKPKDLTKKRVKKINPRFIFFLHWSWKIPKNIFSNYECICFHMTDLPYGRGGNPLQNLISRGHKKTKITAFRIIKDIDAGPIYFKKSMSLRGRAEEIYIRAVNLSAIMISEIIKENKKPKPQKGKITLFHRRKPDDSEIKKCRNIQELYNFIRMLDAEGYPKAFIRYQGFVFEFSCPKISHTDLLTEVKIKKNESKNKK